MAQLYQLHKPEVSMSEFITYHEIDAATEAVREGQIYLIMGENGSGKTSFVKTLVGLNMDKFEGEIFYDDIPIQEVDHWFLRNRLISYVEQDVNLISGSYFENIVVGQETYDEERLTQLLNLFGISPDEDVHDLLNRPVVVGEEKISGGEKRKISIIRGLLKDPDLLILDESEADLDGYSRANLLDYLLTTKSDRITIIISHEKTIQSLADKILLLKEKK
jgi:ATP-binding cassette subfamily C protein